MIKCRNFAKVAFCCDTVVKLFDVKVFTTCIRAFCFRWLLELVNNQMLTLRDIRYNKSFKRDICCFDFRSNFLVSISFLINIGKEMSLPGFRKGV